MNTTDEQPIFFGKPSAKKVTVNGVEISQSLIDEEIVILKEAGVSHAKRHAVQGLVIRYLLHEQLKKNGIEFTEDTEEDATALLVKINTPEIELSDEQCERFYNQDPQRFQSAPLIVVRHILFAVAKDDIKGRADKKILAQELLDEIKAADTDEVLSTFIDNIGASRCPSKSEAGSLGELSAGQTVPEFERQVFMLEEGLAQNLIETRYGYHIVYVDRKVIGKTITFEMCADKIRAYMTERRERQAVSEYLHALVQNAEITGIELQVEQENIVI